MRGSDFDDDNDYGFHKNDFDNEIVLNEFQLKYIWTNVNRVVNNTALATFQNQDKDFWIRNVFRPLLRVVFTIYNECNWSPILLA